ncbi:DUF2190 family protein [Parasphingorhabdus sp.]|uniref:DUF2190 family protein n=1 Tax=Parasphingorhabdus sp. TaxID=2709688 RepID=UPI003FA6EBAD
MKNYVQPGNTLTLTAPAAIISGDVVIVGSIIGIANGDAENAAPVDVDTVGIFRLSCQGSLGFSLHGLGPRSPARSPARRLGGPAPPYGIRASAVS